MSANRYSRRSFMRHVGAVGLFVGLPLPVFRVIAAESDDDALMKRFEYLSKNGNSNCSGAFMESIATMPANARLQGSCCAPMDAHRYVEQIKALRSYANIGEIPPDPYDIEAGLASALKAKYDLSLTPSEQAAYDYAMEKSDERGPCCCGCWRWYVYGGLARQLIRERSFTREQVTEVWNLSSGCGGGAEHRHR
jgi:hypothetical protein